MKVNPMRTTAGMAVLALSLSLQACGVPAFPGSNPVDRAYSDPSVTPATVPDSFSADPAPAPTSVQSPAQAPAPAAQAQAGSLSVASQGSISLTDLQSGCPSQIPQSNAGGELQPLPCPLVNAPAPPSPTGTGCSYGAIQPLVDCSVYSQVRYYRYKTVLVPYVLVQGTYYPYCYEPTLDDTAWSGYCLYPVLVVQNNACYPYFFHETSYQFGFLDWEYDWPVYRTRHEDYDWAALSRYRGRKYDDKDFKNWRVTHKPEPDRPDWHPAEPPRRSGGGGGGDDRSTPTRTPRPTPAPSDDGRPDREGRPTPAPTMTPSTQPAPSPDDQATPAPTESSAPTHDHS